MVLAFVTVSAAFGDSTLQGPDLAVHRPALALVGIDRLTGQARLSFGVPQLARRDRGHDPRRRACSPSARRCSSRRKGARDAGKGRGGQGLGLDDAARTGRGRGSPGCAARPSAFPSAPCRPAAPRSPASCPTRTEKRLPKHPEEFGHGAIEGVAGPEAANNAAAAGTLVPLLTLGLPTTATAAIMLAGFQQFGLQPGPLLFATNAAAGLGPDRQPADRQRHAAGAEPAADRPLGEAADHPAALALCRHPAVRDARHHRRRTPRRSSWRCC